MKPDDPRAAKPNIVGKVQVGKHLIQVTLSPTGLVSTKLLKGPAKTSQQPSNDAIKAFKEAWKKSSYYSSYKDYARFEGRGMGPCGMGTGPGPFGMGTGPGPFGMDDEEDDEEDDDDWEECDCEDEDCDCSDVEEACKGKRKKKPVSEKVETDLIQRALRGLGSGAGELQVAKSLQKSGVTKEDAFSAIKAAKILLADMMKEDAAAKSVSEASTKPLPPLHKWPIKIEKGKSTYTLKDFRIVEVPSPPGSGLYVYELFYQDKSAGKFSSQREVVAKAQALQGS